MFILKRRKIITSIVILFLISISIFFATRDNQTTITFSTDPKDDIDVGKIALGKIHKQVNITSFGYDFNYTFNNDTLPSDPTLMDKIKYAAAGKVIEGTAYSTAEMRSDLLGVKKEDVTFNKKTKVLTIILPDPKLVVHLDLEKTQSKSSHALFSSGFSENEVLRIYKNVEDSGYAKFLIDEKDSVESAKSDIKDGLTAFLSLIEQVQKVKVIFQE